MGVRPWARYAITLCLVLSGCAEPRPALSAPPAPSAPVPAGAGLDCDQPAPPTGDFDYELGFADAGAPDPEARAYQAARDQLARRLCGASDCTGLMAHFKQWTAGEGRGRRCAMVTVLKSHVREHLAATRSVAPLDAALRDRADQLMRFVLARRPPVREPRAVMGAIEDLGLAGGPRAAWLADRVERALADAGFRMVELVDGPGGRRAAGQYELLVTARINERTEGRVELFEVTLRGHVGAERAPLEPVTCGLDAVRSIGQGSPSQLGGRRKELFSDPGLGLEVETGRGGKLCEGDKTQITLRTDKPVHVRVFDLYAKDGGLVIFPNEHQPEDRVLPGRPLPFGGASWFNVFLTPGANQERFFVLAAEDRDDLGPWGALTGTCRLDATAVQRLLDASRIDFPSRARLAETGFRVVTEGCPSPPSAADKQRLLDDLASVPLCRPIR